MAYRTLSLRRRLRFMSCAGGTGVSRYMGNHPFFAGGAGTLVAVVAPSVDEALELLAAADRQLYAAKAAGRNRVNLAMWTGPSMAQDSSP